MLEEICHESDEETSSKINAELELQKYLDDKTTKIDDPMNYWKIKKNEYRSLANLARRFLCAPPTSVSSERLFSTSGIICSDYAGAKTSGTCQCQIPWHLRRCLGHPYFEYHIT
uniref:HAT C-terminal dimerisation domain-containing protein n=1 Tax=Romanomermis culicivorax TaxID=13658 RepID=A0A915KJP7_ROMCU